MHGHLAVFISAALLAAPACKHSKEEMPAKAVAAPAAAPVTAPAEPKAVAPQAPPSAPPLSPAAQKRIATLQALVGRDPTDVKSWIALGNEYFDSQQREKAVEAYGKALQLQPDNPDVLTDQGVMYRELGQYDKAVANFKKANGINPKHLQSLLDLGVVYGNDLKDYDKAMETFNHLIQVAPDSGEAAHAREAIEELKHTPHVTKE